MINIILSELESSNIIRNIVVSELESFNIIINIIVSEPESLNILVIIVLSEPEMMIGPVTKDFHGFFPAYLLHTTCVQNDFREYLMSYCDNNSNGNNNK